MRLQARCGAAQAWRGARADESGRPSYPSEALEWLAQGMGLHSKAHVVELGAGTGKFTRALHATVPGIRLTAVEPTGMAQPEALPVHAWLAESADAMPSVDTASADAVVAAQAFHWFATPQALQEVHRVLVPGGHLGLIWNTTAAVELFANAYYSPDTPRQQSGKWRRAFAAPEAAGLFGPLAHHTQAWTHVVPHASAVNRLMSISVVAARQEDERHSIQQRFEKYLAEQVRFALAAVDADNTGVLQWDADARTMAVEGCLAVLCEEGSASAGAAGGETLSTADGRHWRAAYGMQYVTDAFTAQKLEA